nr:unnamed protein product [Spirometra erinaceieuropaei]
MMEVEKRDKEDQQEEGQKSQEEREKKQSGEDEEQFYDIVLSCSEEKVEEVEEGAIFPMGIADNAVEETLKPVVVKEMTKTLKKWVEHYRGVLHCPSIISDVAIDRLSQVETNTDLNLSLALHETIRTVKQIASRKAPGSDAISDEIYEHGAPKIINRPTVAFKEIRCQAAVTQDFKSATIVHLYKRKGNRQMGDNYRSIALLNIAGKTLAILLISNLSSHLEKGLLPESLRGFRHNCSTTDTISVARQFR